MWRDASARPIGKIDDVALGRSLDGGVRFVDETRQALRQPVVAPRLPALAVHALLHHDPSPVIGDNEAMQVEVEAVLHSRTVDLGDEAACVGKARAVEPRRARRWPQAQCGVCRECLPRPPQT